MVTVGDALIRSVSYYMKELSTAAKLFDSAGEAREHAIRRFDLEWSNILHARLQLLDALRELSRLGPSSAELDARLAAILEAAPILFLAFKRTLLGRLLVLIRRPPAEV